MATGYLGSNSLMTSTSDMEIIPNKPSDWTDGYHVLEFSFSNVQDCTVLVNNTTTIFVPAGKGFEVTKDDPPITSFKVIPSGIQFNWAGIY